MQSLPAQGIHFANIIIGRKSKILRLFLVFMKKANRRNLNNVTGGNLKKAVDNKACKW